MKHQKRLSAPQHYPIKRKDGTYVITGKGPHPDDGSIPVTVLLRDVLEYTETAAEVQEILNTGRVYINGRPIKNDSLTVGFMDVIEIKPIDVALRVVIDKDGIALKEVEDPSKRLYQVNGKTSLKGGITQLNLDSGVNREVTETYATQSSLLVDLSSDSIEKEITLDEGNLVYIVDGRHAGKMATVESVEVVHGPQANRVICSQETDTFETIDDYVFVIGHDSPEVEV